MKERIKIFKNKKLLILLIITIGSGGYFIYSRQINNKVIEGYILTKVKKGTVQKTISTSGYVTTTNSFEIKPEISGKIILITKKEGDYVKKGDLLIKLDDEEIKRQIRKLENNIKNLDKDIELSQIELNSMELNYKKNEDDYKILIRGDELRKTYEDFLKNFSRLTLDLSNDLEILRKIYFENDFETIKNNLEYYASYYPEYKNVPEILVKKYNILKEGLQPLSEELSRTIYDIQNLNYDLIVKSYNYLIDWQNFIKIGFDLVKKIKEDLNLTNSKHIKSSLIDDHYSDLNSIYLKYSSYLDNLSTYYNTINKYKDNLQQKEYDLKNLELSISQKKISIDKLKENKNQLNQDLEDLYKDIKKYSIYSPLSGIVSGIKNKIGDSVSPQNVILEIISNDKIIELDVNEIDLPEIKMGQEAVIEFDAIPNLKLKGKIFYISPVAEINQGVVTYKVKLYLEDNQKIKIGMTVNVEIIVQSKKDVLIIPNSAIKNFEGKNYVEIPDNKENIRNINNRPIKLTYPLKRVFIKTGISDSNNTEVIEGLKEGDIIVVRKIENNFNNQQSQGLFQRLLPNPRQFAPQPRPQSIQRQFQR
ncbi:MAG: hypothetical protein KatS3mg095_0927 [Candidatus Parcubacteria bacterium]|nr:MAG: hypothetical protein KatS3mg095_0927 [Candidatus Parcubacteria bacterium]